MTDFENDHQLPALQQPKQQSLSLYRQLMPDREADMMRAQCMSGGEWEYGRWLMLNPPSPEVKERLQKRHRDIATNLSHHDRLAVAAAVSDVMACYRNFVKAGENPEKVVAKYVKELNGIPTWACVRACDAIRNGHAKDISLEFPFSTIQLRALAESYIKRLQDEAREISQIMLGGVLPAPASPEMRAKVGRNLARLAFKMRGDRKREDDAILKPMLARMKHETDDTIIREYRHKGEAPVFASGNVLVSPQLLAITNEWRVRNASGASDRGTDETASSSQGGEGQDTGGRR